MHVLLESIAEHIVPVMIAGCVIVGMTLHALSSIVRTRSRERSRREIAAYVAEGSMTPAQGERLMAAGEDDESAAG